ncbi:MAG: ABC transporter substrate-binding protein [bacterium]|nr:ABC transporter substrate-binding protein [bacterium]
MNSFQTIILGVFGFFIIAGLLAVAMVKQGGDAQKVTVTIWGSRPRVEVQNLIANLYGKSETVGVSYREIGEANFDQTVIEALAVDKGPDLILLPLELLLRYRDKIRPVPYDKYTQRTFQDTFIQEGDHFLQADGIVAFPLVLDPLIMYFNRDFLDEAGITTPPKYWDEFLTLARDISVKDETGNLSRSAVALGEYRNILSAKEILSALFLQSGSSIFGLSSTGNLRGTLTQEGTSAVLDFYTEFANPLKPVYSWNRSLPLSKEQFTASELAIYFGFGSEYTEIQRTNPNLNFDVGLFPRPRNATVGITYGKLTGVAMLRSARNPSVALQVALTLGSPQAAGFLHKENGLPPVHRSLLSDKPADPFLAVLYDSASRSRGFLDPNPAVSGEIFRTMVESVTSGRARSPQALGKANQELQSALR